MSEQEQNEMLLSEGEENESELSYDHSIIITRHGGGGELVSSSDTDGLPAGTLRPPTGKLAPYELGLLRINSGITPVNTLWYGSDINGGIALPVVALKAIQIVQTDGFGASCGSSKNPVYLEDGIFKTCSSDLEFEGVVTAAKKWEQPVQLLTYLNSNSAASVDGSRDENSIGVTGTLGIANGGTGGSTKAAAVESLIKGQTIEPVVVKVGQNRYLHDNKAGIDMNNSDIINANGIWFKDTSSAVDEGIHFKRTNGKWDTFRMVDGYPSIQQNHELNAETVVNRRIAYDNGIINSLVFQGTTYESTSYADSNPKIKFFNSDASQCVSLTFTDYDTQGGQASLTLNGNQGFEMFKAPFLYGTLVAQETWSWGTSKPSAYTFGMIPKGRIFFQVVD